MIGHGLFGHVFNASTAEHDANGNYTKSTYGIVAFAFDPAGRLQLKTDQNGDTVTFVYDLASRMTQRDYRTKANSPSGTIADSDTFTFDRSSRMLTAVSGRYSNTVTHTFGANDGRQANESLTTAGQTYTVGRELLKPRIARTSYLKSGTTYMLNNLPVVNRFVSVMSVIVLSALTLCNLVECFGIQEVLSYPVKPAAALPRRQPPSRNAEMTPAYSNAATCYYRAILSSEIESDILDDERKNSQLHNWLGMDLDKLPQEQIRIELGKLADTLKHLAQGARMEICDWGAPGVDDYALTRLSELANCLRIRAVLHIANEEYDAAYGDIVTGFNLARHLGFGRSIRHFEFGYRIAGDMCSTLTRLQLVAESPNLYWHLTGLQRPLLSIDNAAQMHFQVMVESLPEIEEMTTRVVDDGQVEWVLNRIAMRLELDSESIARRKALLVEAAASQMAPSTWNWMELLKGEHDRIPSTQKAICDAFFSARASHEKLLSWLNVDWPDSAEELESASDQYFNARDRLDALLTDRTLAGKTLYENSTRDWIGLEYRAMIIERNIDRAIAVEAIRDYLAENHSGFPTSLSDEGLLPVPTDPLTGRPFLYLSEKGTGVASISFPAPPPSWTYSPSIKRWPQTYEMTIIK